MSLPNNREAQAPSFTFSIDELGDVRSLDRVLRRIQSAIADRPVPITQPIDINALAKRLRSMLEAPGIAPLNLTALIPSGSSGGTDIEVTHAVRLSTYTPPTLSIGQGLFETDRTVRYIVYDSSGTLVWRYAGGTYPSAIANRPSDLGLNDAGFIFVDTTTDTETMWVWDGAEWLTVGGYLQEISDAATNAITTLFVLRHLTSGAATTGFGAGQLWQLENASGTTVSAARESIEWSDATAGSEDALYRLLLIVAGGLAEVLNITSVGLMTLVGDYVWKSSTAFTGTLAHNNTADRIYTFPDKDLTWDYNTYTPTHTALSNLDTTTPRVTGYSRVGNMVTISGGFSADPTAAGACSFEMSLPIASNFANTFEAGGTSALEVGGEPGGISAVVANDTLLIQWVAAVTVDSAYTFTVTYRII